MDEELKAFLYKNKALIQENTPESWRILYQNARSNPFAVCRVTSCFLEAGVDPAEIMWDIPPLYLARSKILSYTVPQGIIEIGDMAFYGCSVLTSVTIPNSVTLICERAFEDCSKLTRIDFNGTKAQWNAVSKGSDWKGGIGSLTIYCMDGEIGLSSK